MNISTGVCTRPLALVLDLAPLGAMDVMLRHYRRSGASLTPSTLQQTILQVIKTQLFFYGAVKNNSLRGQHLWPQLK